MPRSFAITVVGIRVSLCNTRITSYNVCYTKLLRISRAGYDLHEFSTKLPKIVDWIDGTKKPTIKQLEAFSKKVHLPFGYLFLQKPPTEKLPIPYFRSNGNRAEKVSVNVYDTIQLMVQRQDWLREYLKDSEFDKLAFVGAFNQINDVEKIVRDIRNILNFV